jgi:hypothetical protein
MSEKEQLALIVEELKSKGIVSAKVSDGTLFLFSRGVVEELYARLQRDPNTQEVHLMVYSNPAKLNEALSTQKNAC